MKLGLIGSAFRRDDPKGVPLELQGLLDPRTEVEIYLPRVSRFPNNPIDLKIQEIGYLDAGIKAVEDGCDAIVLNSFGDYGLAALKSATKVPVVGAGEAGMSIAASLGSPFAIVTVWPRSTEFLYASVLRAAGLQSSCAGVLHVGSEEDLASLGTDDDYIALMQRGERGVVGRIADSCRKAESDGAGSILLGCTCMSSIAAELAGAVDIPVINPLTAAAKYGEMLALLSIAQSPVSFPRSGLESLGSLRALVDAAASVVGSDSCEICALVVAGDGSTTTACTIDARLARSAES